MPSDVTVVTVISTWYAHITIYSVITLLFEESRYFAPTRVLFRLCNVCLLPEYVSETEKIHITSGDARLGRCCTAGSWEPQELQKLSATGCHGTWQPLYNNGQYQEAAAVCYLRGVRVNRESKSS